MNFTVQGDQSLLCFKDRSTGKLHQIKPDYIRTVKQSRYAEINYKGYIQNVPNKVKLLFGTTLAIIAISCLILYRCRTFPEVIVKNKSDEPIQGTACLTENPGDDFNNYECAKGKWIPTPWQPPKTAFDERKKICAEYAELTKDSFMAGCFGGHYYHHLSKECHNSRARNLGGYKCEFEVYDRK